MRHKRLVYIANMNLILPNYEQNDFERVQTVLEETRTNRYRGIEWNYWNRLCHLDVVTLQGHDNSIELVTPQ